MAHKRNHRHFLASIALLLVLGALACRTILPEPPAGLQPSSTPGRLPGSLPSSIPTVPPPATVLPGEGIPPGERDPGGTPNATIQAAPDSASGQGLALLPSARGDLQALSSLPHYRIQAQLDESGRSFQGHASVAYENAETTALDRLYFRLLPNGGSSYGSGTLTTSNVQVNGQPAETQLSQQDTVLEVRLPGSLAPGDRLQIDLDFAGTVPVDFGGSDSPDGYGIYNFSDGVLVLSAWYPLLAVFDQDDWNLDPPSPIGDSVYADMAFYTVEIAAPSEWVLAATGQETGQQEQAGTVQHRFESGPVREFSLAASPNFSVESQEVAGIQVNSYTLRRNRQGGQAALEIGSEALQVFNQVFGAYPYTELDIVGAPMRYAAGVEFPGLILISEGMYQFSQNPFFQETVAHEVAHQWWYNLVGNDIFDDPWLDEALATYSAALYFQAAGNEALYQSALENYQEQVDRNTRFGQDDLVTGSLSHFEQLGDPGVYSAVVYAKGALFLNAVRQAIGDQAFFQALQAYYAENIYQIASPAELLEAFEAASGRQLDELYQERLYSAER